MLNKGFLLACLACFLISSARASEVELQLLARSNIVLEEPGLSSDQWRWVRERQKLRLAVWLPMSPPYDITTGLSDYGGINADFIGLIATNLNIKVQVIRFASYDDALAAVKQGEADIIAQAGSSQRQAGLVLSQPYSKNRPVEVINIDAPGLAREQNIAICPQYDQQAVLSHYPGAHVATYSSNRHALEALAFRHIDLFICDATTVQYLISQSNLSNLSARPVARALATEGFSFAALPKEKQWIEAIDKVLAAIPESVSVEIHRRWNGGIPLSLSEQRPVFTTLEKKWIEEHRRIRVAVIAENNPLSWFNPSNQMRGIIADILTALRLRTGLIFDIQPYPSFDAALKAVENDKSDIVAGAIQTSIWHHNLLTTRTWLYNSWVMVGKKSLPADMQTPRIVTQLALAPVDWLERHHDEQIVNVDTWRAGLTRVVDGKSDIMIMPLIVANDWLAAGDYASLKILGSIDTPPMRFSFGSSRRLYPLVMILNKALINIPPEDLHAITRNGGSGNELAVQRVNPFLAHQGLAISLLLGFVLLMALAGWYLVVLRRRLRTVTKSARRAAAASEVKSTFLATMSHEIRNPVSAISGMLELVMHRPQDVQANRQRVQIAWQGAQSLLALIGNILDVSRIEADKLVLHPERVVLLELIESIALLFESLARQKGLVFRLELDSALEGEVFVDPLRLRQIVSNLLSNAIKFTPSGAVTLRAIREDDEPGKTVNLRLTIEDTGAGIDPAIQQQLFQPFSQGEGRLVGQGSGLGLFICRKIVEMMGGDVALTSEQAWGTQVTVRLRLPGLPPSISPPLAKIDDRSKHKPRLTVLVVDDNPAGRMLLEHQLQHLGHRGIGFASAQELLHYLEHHPASLVITDCNMPGMDGFELAAVLRSRYPDLCVFGLTADARDSARDKAIEAGMNACLFKPLCLDQLDECLSGLNVPEPEEIFAFALPPALAGGENERAFLELQLSVLEATLAWLPAWAASSEADITSRLHHLRGGLQLLGVAEIESLCLSLEQQANPQGMAELEGLLTKLGAALQERLQTLSTVLQPNADACAS